MPNHSFHLQTVSANRLFQLSQEQKHTGSCINHVSCTTIQVLCSLLKHLDKANKKNIQKFGVSMIFKRNALYFKLYSSKNPEKNVSVSTKILSSINGFEH